MDAELRRQIEKVLKLAMKELKDAGQVERWLQTTKIALQGQTPLERLWTPEGCKEVTKLLKTVNK